MLVLIGIGLAAGFITAISPCVLPVLPIIFAGGATGSRRKPFAIIAGLIVSFTAFTLFGVWLLKKLGLPEDLLRNVAIALLFLVAATLLFPKVEEIVQRPFLRLTRRPGSDLGGGFLLGASLGLVFVPCAGPVLAAITVVGATQDVGARAVVLTLAYATGAAIPLLLVAFGGRAGANALRPHAHRIRQALGLVVALTALAIALNVDRHFQTAIPGYTESLQKKVEQSGRAQHELQKFRGATAVSDTTLHDGGPAPELAGLTNWTNSKPLTLKKLHGKVVLVDFWTYSCINCLRTLPHVKAWYQAFTCGSVRRQLMHEYVQKSTRTTFPRSFRSVSGLLLIQFVSPASSGAGPASCSVVLETAVVPRSFCSSRWARPLCSTFFWSDSV